LRYAIFAPESRTFGWLIDTFETLKAEGWIIGELILGWDWIIGGKREINFFFGAGSIEKLRRLLRNFYIFG
jgi:hypothetical protein